MLPALFSIGALAWRERPAGTVHHMSEVEREPSGPLGASIGGCWAASSAVGGGGLFGPQPRIKSTPTNTIQRTAKCRFLTLRIGQKQSRTAAYCSASEPIVMPSCIPLRAM